MALSGNDLGDAILAAVDAQAAAIDKAERDAVAAAKADAKLTAQAKLAKLG